MKIRYSCVLLIFIIGIAFPEISRPQYLMIDTNFHFNVNENVNGLAIDSEGSCLLVGKMETDSLTPKNIWMKKLSFEYDSIILDWEKTYIPQNSSRVGAVIQTADKNYLVAGSWNNSRMIHRVSISGDSLDTYLFSGNGSRYFTDIIELPDGDLIVLEHESGTYWYGNLLRISADGNIIWESNYTDFRLQSLQYFNADTFFVAGSEQHLSYEHLSFLSFTTDGNMIFNNFYQDFYGKNNCGVNDSSYLYLGNQKEYASSGGLVSEVLKMDKEGEIQWAVDFTGIGSEIIKDIVAYDNYLITGSDIQSFLGNGIIIAAITYDGILADYFLYEKANSQVNVIGTHENLLYVAGRQNTDTAGKDVYFLMFDLDSTFVISTTNESVMVEPVNIFPNPARENISIELNDNFDLSTTTITVFNLNGTIEKRIHSAGKRIQQIYIGDLNKGIYFVSISRKMKKPVIQKIIKY